MLNPGDWLDRVFDFFFKKHPIGYKKMHPIYLKYKEWFIWFRNLPYRYLYICAFYRDISLEYTIC